MMRIISIVVLAAAALSLLSCSSSKPIPLPFPDISGGWEFVATSSTSVTGIEVALKEGQTIVDGFQQPDGQLSASGSTQIAFVTLDSSTSNITAFGGSCPPNGTNPVNDLTGNITRLDGLVTLSYHEAGNLFNATATLGLDGQSMTGTFAAAAGSNCNVSGTFTGTFAPKLSGTYTGQLVLPDGTTDTATAILSQNSSGVLSVNLVITGATLTLSGPVMGHSFYSQGTFQGQGVSYYGYYELILDPVSHASIPSLYFVDATNPSLPKYVGTLSMPLT
jgi:hypothetical protein